MICGHRMPNIFDHFSDTLQSVFDPTTPDRKLFLGLSRARVWGYLGESITLDGFSYDAPWAENDDGGFGRVC